MKNRSPRKTVLIPAKIRTDGAWVDVRIRNVSTRGLMLETRSPLNRGTYLEIARTRLRITGRVVWSGGGHCGIQTRDDIDLGSLAGSGEAAAEPVSTARPAAVVAGRSKDRSDGNRLLGRLMEFAVVAACTAGGGGLVSHVAYSQIAGTVEVIQSKL